MCEKCDNTGWVIGTQMIEGTILEVGMQCPVCRDARIKRKIQKMIPGDVLTWEKLDYSYNRIEDTVKDARVFFTSKTHRRMILIGKTGTGKTTILRALLYDRISAGVNVFFTTAKALKERFINMVDDWEEYNDFFYDLEESQELFIDGIGEEPGTSSEQFECKLEEIFDRYPRRIICTANKSPNPEENESFRLPYRRTLLSRMCEGTLIVPFTGKDYRLKGIKK